MAARIEALQETPASTGSKIYEGSVYALDGRPEPLFQYERRVSIDGVKLTSTHITRDPSGAVVVVQSARHSSTYEIARAEMIHRQSGITASVDVANGQATFRVTDGDREVLSHETIREPVVAGPTLFGFILARWDELRSGASLPVRFAVLERGETLGFTLDAAGEADGRTTIRMTPTNLLVRMAVSPTYFHFDTVSRRIIEYTGRVPPFERVNGRLQTLDARVHYTFTAPRFQ